MPEPFVPELKKPGDMFRAADWNRAYSEIKELKDSKHDREGAETHHGPLEILGDLEVSGELSLGGVFLGAERGFGNRQQTGFDSLQTAADDGLVVATIEAGLDASGRIAGETPVGQTRLSVVVPVAEPTSLMSDRVPRLVPEAGAPGDAGGFSVAISGDTAVIGAPMKDADNLTDAGCAYVYVREDDRWVRQARLVAEDRAANDRFGSAVAISGDTIIVGAPGKGSFATKTEGGVKVSLYPEVGASYVFVRKGGAWTQQAALRRAAHEEAKWVRARDGSAVAIEGDVAVVGAPAYVNNCGIAWAYTRKGESWSNPFELYPTNHNTEEGNGTSVAISGDTILFGAPLWRTNNGRWWSVGVVFAFIRKGDQWVQQGGEITPANRRADSRFGASVALDGDTALVGEPMHNPPTAHLVANDDGRGAAYIFVRKGGAWMEQARLAPKDSSVGDLFGESVALSGNYALIGAPANPSRGEKAGAVYLFERRGEKWLEVTQWVAGDGGDDDAFGTAVALRGKTALIGSPQGRNEASVRCGAAYLSNVLPPARANSFTMPVRKGDTWIARLSDSALFE